MLSLMKFLRSMWIQVILAVVLDLIRLAGWKLTQFYLEELLPEQINRGLNDRLVSSFAIRNSSLILHVGDEPQRDL